MENHAGDPLLGYCRNGAVMQRMAEFLGGTSTSRATAAFILGGNGYGFQTPPSPPQWLPAYCKAGFEIDRSLWDQRDFIADLDIDFVNFDSALEPYLDPLPAFTSMKPVVDVLTLFLASNGIHPLQVVSGRGHHFLWAIPRDSEPFRQLAHIGEIPDSLAATYARTYVLPGKRVERELGCAFAGLGKLMEFVGHQVLGQASPVSLLPLQLAIIEVGGQPGNRRAISIDLSEYGDPLHTRCVRLPFSPYLKPRQLEWAAKESELPALSPIFAIPARGLSVEEAIHVMRDPDQTVRLAKEASAFIPEEATGTASLIDAYEHSEVARFHQWSAFAHGGEPEHPGRTVRSDLPPCAQWVLDHPNDLLLKPGFHQFIVRTLLALGWAPASIADRIAECFHADFGWGDRFRTHDRNYRAQFYTRLFAGLVATGCDSLVDLNCASHKEKGYCMIPECCDNLLLYQISALTRRQNERLGRRPFNRLLLANEYL